MDVAARIPARRGTTRASAACMIRPSINGPRLLRLGPFSIAFGLLVTACGGGTADAPPPVAPSSPAAAEMAHASPSASSELKKPGEAKVGDKTKCPVSGEEFVVTEGSPKLEYQGRTYYFCCPGCDKRFGAEPKKYLPQ